MNERMKALNAANPVWIVSVMIDRGRHISLTRPSSLPPASQPAGKSHSDNIRPRRRRANFVTNSQILVHPAGSTGSLFNVSSGTSILLEKVDQPYSRTAVEIDGLILTDRRLQFIV